MSVFLSYADKGSSFVYGYLVTGQPFNPDKYAPNATFGLNGTDLIAAEVAGIFNNNGYIFGIKIF